MTRLVDDILSEESVTSTDDTKTTFIFVVVPEHKKAGDMMDLLV